MRFLSFSQSPDDRDGDMAWVGCPVVIEQLLYIVHRHVEQVVGHNWTRRPIPRLVDMINQVDMIATTLGEIVTAIHAKKEDGWSEIEDAMEDYAQLQD